MLINQSYNKYQTVNESKKQRKRSLLFDRVQTKEVILSSDFRKYINKNVNIYHRDPHKRTLLHFCAQNYHFEVFQYLIDNYPKLLTYQCDKDMNIMHYIASSRIDDKQMVELITNKKYTYNKLIWCRDINGCLPKDTSKQCNNQQISKSFEAIMHDTWEQYHHIARHNNNNNNNNNINNNNDIYLEDVDMDDNNTINNDNNQSKNISLSPPNIPYRSISICARKRQRETVKIRIENDDFENYYPSLPDNSNKRRKLNSNGTYLRTTPSQPEISPSPLPPLPPIQLTCTPFQLNSYNEMDEIRKLYYNGKTMTKQQFMFVKWYKKCIGNMSYLSVIINEGYDNVNKFMKLNKQMCMTLFGNGIFDNNIMDMHRFTNRIRDLQLSPLSNDSLSNSNECISQSMRDLSIEENVNVRNHASFISDSVINSSDSTQSCDEVFLNDNKKNHNIISFPWACEQCDASEDDDL